MRKYLALFLCLNLFAGSSLIPSKVFAQENTEEGEEGPPQEAPFVEDPDLEELMDETPAPKVEAKPQEPAPSPILDDEIVEAPVVQNKPKFIVPKKPVTVQGKETGSEKIYHPAASKGLLEIQKDGSYIYDPTKTEVKNVSASIRLGQITPPPQIEGSTPAISFESVYGSASPAQLSFDYEWYPFAEMGKLGLQGGFGLFRSHGKGRFVKDGTQAREEYDFYGIPLSLGAIYRLQISNSSWFAPFVAGGGSVYGLAEKRDDDDPWHYGFVGAFYGTGGVLINISSFDHQTKFNLANEYGVQNIWLVLEARAVQSVSKDLDVSATVFSGGMVLDY